MNKIERPDICLAFLFLRLIVIPILGIMISNRPDSRHKINYIISKESIFEPKLMILTIYKVYNKTSLIIAKWGGGMLD